LYHLQAAAPFIGPLKYVEDFSRLDPLASLVQCMANVVAGEEIIYELSVTSPSQDYNQLGEKLLTTSTIKWWEFLTIPGAIDAASRKALKTDRVEKYIPEIQQMAQDKLKSPLMEVTLAVKVKAVSQNQADNLVSLLAPALALFEREGINFLVAAGERSFPLVLTPSEIGSLWHLPTEHCRTPGVNWVEAIASSLPAALFNQRQGIVLGTNIYQGRAQEVRLPYRDRLRHLNLIGKTGMGKSTLFHRMIHQDIANGKGVGVIDPHGDLVKDILAKSIPLKREKDVVLFDLADEEYPIGLNLLTVPAGLSLDNAARSVLDALRKMFDYWNPRIQTLSSISVRALVGIERTTIKDILELFYNSDFRQSVLSRVDKGYDSSFWSQRWESMLPSEQMDWLEAIEPRLRELYEPLILRRIMCQSGCLDVRQFMDSSKIILADLGGEGKVSEAGRRTIGALLLAKFQMAMMSRADIPQSARVPFYLYIDELQKFASEGTLLKMVDEARKYGLGLTVGNQRLSQLHRATIDAVVGSTSASVIFQVDPRDADILLPYVKSIFAVEDLARLSLAHTIVRMQVEGKSMEPFSMATLSPLKGPTDALVRIKRIRKHSRTTYARPAAVVDKELRRR
jgi:hypothetical protein